jgi:amino-acid N-acetyltransferase
MKVELRRARPSDLPAIDALIVSEHLPAFRTADFLDTFWVLEGEDGLVGCAGLEVYGVAALLRSVVTAPPARGKGYGAALVRRVIEEAARMGVRRLYLFTMDKAPFFRRFGFQPCTMDDFEPAARQSTQYRLLDGHPEVARVLTAMRLELPDA